MDKVFVKHKMRGNNHSVTVILALWFGGVLVLSICPSSMARNHPLFFFVLTPGTMPGTSLGSLDQLEKRVGGVCSESLQRGNGDTSWSPRIPSSHPFLPTYSSRPWSSCWFQWRRSTCKSFIHSFTHGLTEHLCGRVGAREIGEPDPDSHNLHGTFLLWEIILLILENHYIELHYVSGYTFIQFGGKLKCVFSLNNDVK